MKKFTVYGRPGCGYCSAAVSLLKAHQLEFDYVDMYREGISKQQLEKTTGRVARTVPQILFGEEYIGGYTDLYAYLSARKAG
jgi:glutaredoxin 1